MSPNPRLVPVETRLIGQAGLPAQCRVKERAGQPGGPGGNIRGLSRPSLSRGPGGFDPYARGYWVRGNPEVSLGRNDGFAGGHEVGLPEEGPVRRLAHEVGADKRDMELWADTVSPSGRAAPVSWMES